MTLSLTECARNRDLGMNPVYCFPDVLMDRPPGHVEIGLLDALTQFEVVFVVREEVHQAG